MRIIKINWVDSVRASDWTLLEDVDDKLLDCVSVGFLIKETARILIAVLVRHIEFAIRKDNQPFFIGCLSCQGIVRVGHGLERCLP